MKHPAGAALCVAVMATASALPGLAASLTVVMHKATQDGTGETLGTVIIADSASGATFTLALHGLPPGPHGFLVHDNANCDPTLLNGVRIPAGAAGGPFDPEAAYKHEGPTGEGYLGDLPVVVGDAKGASTQILTAPRIKDVTELKGHSLIIHIGGDNYSDTPSLMGGSGGRLACGLME